MICCPCFSWRLLLKSVIVIPARYESTRLPRKMLLAETGKSLIQHTYEAASKSKLADAVIVATDHADIAAAVTQFLSLIHI